MSRSVVRAVVSLAAGCFAVAASAKPYVDYTPGRGIWEVDAISVDPNHLDDYLTGLKRTQIPGFELLKKRGLIDDYKILVRNGFTKDNPTVLTMTHYPSLSALEPDRARDQAIEKEMLASMSEAEGKAAVAGYEKYRSFIDDAYYSEVTYGPAR